MNLNVLHVWFSYFNFISSIIFLMAFSRFAESKESSLSSPNSSIVFENRYYLKRFLKKTSNFSMYEGIDKTASKFVAIYLKSTNTTFNFNKKIKAELRAKISPHLLWEGIYKQNTSTFNVQVHQKYGPSLQTMFEYVKDNINQQDFLLLMYQMLKLVERYSTVGYVYRELDMDQIVFDPRPEKNELYLLNTFPLRKKGEESPILCTKYSSRAAHLGLRASQKDDVESICYILLDIFTNGSFLENCAMGEYELEKSHIDFSKLGKQVPQIFKEFYHYVITLNYNDEVNFFKWRSEIYSLITKQALSEPYGWMKNKGGEYSDLKMKALKQSRRQRDAEELSEELLPEDKENLDAMKGKTLIKKNIT